MYNKKEFIVKLFDIGVSGYVLKNAGKKELVNALVQIKSGNSYFSLTVLNEIAKSRSIKSEFEKVQLTDKEKEVITLVGEGKTSKEIAEKLKMKINTVNTHKRNLRNKLEVPNEKFLVRYAIKHGYTKV